MQITYTYPDNSCGSARAFENNDSVIPASYLAYRDGEADAAWATRLGDVGVLITRTEASSADPNTHDPGEPVATVTDGITYVTYPRPVPKVPVWSTSTRERMYISTGAEVPPGYTDVEPLDSLFAIYADGAWNINEEAQAAAVRIERDRRLAECDWTQLTDAPLDEASRSAWTAYRQALRDVPQQAGFPGAVEWPGELAE